MLRYYHLTKKLLMICGERANTNDLDDDLSINASKEIFQKIYDALRITIYGSDPENPRILSNTFIEEFEYFSMNLYMVEKHYYDTANLIERGQVIHSYSPRDEESIQESFEEVVSYLYLHHKRNGNRELTHRLSMNFYKIIKEQCGLDNMVLT